MSGPTAREGLIITTRLRRSAWDELTPRECYEILRLRVDVFVVEQACPYPELDGRDLEPDVDHVWVEGDDGSVLAYLRVLAEPDVAGMGSGRRIGRVVTAPHARGRGLGRDLMNDVLARYAGEPMVLDAQTYAQDFYATFEFTPVGDVFDEDGIPHRRMVRGVHAPPSAV